MKINIYIYERKNRVCEPQKKQDHISVHTRGYILVRSNLIYYLRSLSTINKHTCRPTYTYTSVEHHAVLPTGYIDN